METAQLDPVAAAVVHRLEVQQFPTSAIDQPAPSGDVRLAKGSARRSRMHSPTVVDQAGGVGPNRA